MFYGGIYKAMSSFIITLGIVLGILTPLVAIASLVFLFWLFGNVALDLWSAISDKISQRPPYDDMEIQRNFIDASTEIRYYRKGKEVWRHTITDKQLRERTK